MSVYKVERKVDTVIIEMDASVAEALLEVLGQVVDHTGMGTIETIRRALSDSGEIREPSKMYECDGAIKIYDAHRGNCYRNCSPADPYAMRPSATHYLDCTVWKTTLGRQHTPWYLKYVD